MRKEFEMTEAQLSKLLSACQPVRLIALQCGPILSPQQNANDAWDALGDEMGFIGSTAQPIGKGDRFFTAEVKP